MEMRSLRLAIERSTRAFAGGAQRRWFPTPQQQLKAYDEALAYFVATGKGQSSVTRLLTPAVAELLDEREKAARAAAIRQALAARAAARAAVRHFWQVAAFVFCISIIAFAVIFSLLAMLSVVVSYAGS